MKRAKNLFEKLIGDENLGLAIDEVNRTHRWRPKHRTDKTVAWVESTRSERISELRAMIEGGYTPSPPRRSDAGTRAPEVADIYEPRLWPDQYIHHALVQVLQPAMMRAWTRGAAGVSGDGVSTTA